MAAADEDTPLLQSRWKNIINTRFLFESFSESEERRERRRKLHTSCVGAAAFLIRDAVLGEIHSFCMYCNSSLTRND